MNWMSQKIHSAQQHQTIREQTEAGTLGGVNAVASFEEYDINMESIREFQVNIINKTGECAGIFHCKIRYRCVCVFLFMMQQSLVGQSLLIFKAS
jgi:hypothetical protein